AVATSRRTNGEGAGAGATSAQRGAGIPAFVAVTATVRAYTAHFGQPVSPRYAHLARFGSQGPQSDAAFGGGSTGQVGAASGPLSGASNVAACSRRQELPRRGQLSSFGRPIGGSNQRPAWAC